MLTDIHQMCCFFLSFIFLSLRSTSSSSLSIPSLSFSSLDSYFVVHAVILSPTHRHPRFSCARISSVSMVTIIRAERSGNRGSISCRSRDICVIHRKQIIFVALPPCRPIDAELFFFPGSKAAGVEVNHSPSFI